jgi:hypothetical protein
VQREADEAKFGRKICAAHRRFGLEPATAGKLAVAVSLTEPIDPQIRPHHFARIRLFLG